VESGDRPRAAPPPRRLRRGPGRRPHCPDRRRQHRPDRWRLVDEFIEVWHRPLAPEDGYSEAELRAAEQRLGCELPAALREWYALAGRRADVWSRQDRLLPPDRLRIDPGSGTLIVRSENQGCEHWGIRVADLSRDDPPVWEVRGSELASPTTTAFACLVLLYEVKFARGVAWAGIEGADEEVRAGATRGLRRCDLPDRYWAASPLQLFEGTNLIVEYHSEDWVYVTARGKDALRGLDGEFRRRLEVYRS
jgi:hypothetical protein